MSETIKVPEIGENVESGVVVAVHIKAGQTIAVDDTVIEMETDKALVEIPSPVAGRVVEVLAEAGAQMNVGDVIARVDTKGEGETDSGASPSDVDVDQPADTGAGSETDAAAESGTPFSGNYDRGDEDDGGDDAVVPPQRPPAPAAPSIRRLARELGVDVHDVRGSGPGGRISEADVKSHVRKRLPDQGDVPGQMPYSAPSSPALPDFSRWGAVETESIDTVRRLTAQSTTNAWATIPHVTQYDEADITRVEDFIEKHARRAEKAGTRLTLTAILTRICAEALKRFPRFNASIDMTGGRIIRKHYVHIGIAADTSRGLLVPVVRDADRKGILELAKEIGDLAERARNKKIKPDEMEGGTFTISNQGGIGGVGFTPIVLWPQVAILGVSRSAVKPVYLDDRFEPRTMLPLALSYDHRIIDGADAARFLRWICDGLEQPLTMMLD